MSRSEKSLAFGTGAPTGTFTIADRKFHVRQLVIEHVNEYLALDGGIDAKRARLLEHLNERLADKGEPIDEAFLNAHLSYTEFGQVVDLLLWGRVRDPNDPN